MTLKSSFSLVEKGLTGDDSRENVRRGIAGCKRR